MGAPEYGNIAGPQTDFLVQFAIQGLFSGLTVFDTTLGELPRMLTAAPCPQDAPFSVGHDNAHIRPETLRINHLSARLRPGQCLVFFHIRDSSGKSSHPHTEAAVPLALFDLDNTLLAEDSDHLWGHFLADRRIVDKAGHREQNERFRCEYERGQLDIDAFLAFALAPLAANEPSDLYRWRAEFVRDWIEPVIAPAARQLVEQHRERGDTLAIVTATNRFITEPIAERFDIPHLLATEPEIQQGRFTGRHIGTPTFREGKITVLAEWLAHDGLSMAGSTFYSDSLNDLPLLRRVDHPVAVDPDPQLAEAARTAGWPIVTLRAGERPSRVAPAPRRADRKNGP